MSAPTMRYRPGSVYRRDMLQVIDDHSASRCGICEPGDERAFWEWQKSLREEELKYYQVEWDPDIEF